MITINSITYSLKTNNGFIDISKTPSTGGVFIESVSIMELPYWLTEMEAQGGTVKTIVTADNVIFNMDGQLAGADFLFVQEGNLFNVTQPNNLDADNVFYNNGFLIVGNKNQSGPNTVITNVTFVLPKTGAAFGDDWDDTLVNCTIGVLTPVDGGDGFWHVAIDTITAVNNVHANILFAAP